MDKNKLHSYVWLSAFTVHLETIITLFVNHWPDSNTKQEDLKNKNLEIKRKKKLQDKESYQR